MKTITTLEPFSYRFYNILNIDLILLQPIYFYMMPRAQKSFIRRGDFHAICTGINWMRCFTISIYPSKPRDIA